MKKRRYAVLERVKGTLEFCGSHHVGCAHVEGNTCSCVCVRNIERQYSALLQQLFFSCNGKGERSTKKTYLTSFVQVVYPMYSRSCLLISFVVDPALEIATVVAVKSHFPNRPNQLHFQHLFLTHCLHSQSRWIHDPPHHLKRYCQKPHHLYFLQATAREKCGIANYKPSI